MSNKMVRFSLASLLIALGAFTSASGCGRATSSVCDVVCFCQGCTPAERDTCAAEAQANEQKASELGCEAEFDLNVRCLQDENKVRCVGMRATTENCSPQLGVLNQCLRDNEPVPGGSETGGGG